MCWQIVGAFWLLERPIGGLLGIILDWDLGLVAQDKAGPFSQQHSIVWMTQHRFHPPECCTTPRDDFLGWPEDSDREGAVRCRSGKLSWTSLRTPSALCQTSGEATCASSGSWYGARHVLASGLMFCSS